MMNKQSHPHLSWRATPQEAMQQVMGLRQSEMRPGQAQRMTTGLKDLQAVQASIRKQYPELEAVKASTRKQYAATPSPKSAAAHRERMLALATVLGGTPRAP